MNKYEQIEAAAFHLESLAKVTGSNVLHLINAVTGLACDEEDAGRIKNYLSEGPATDPRDEQIKALRKALRDLLDRDYRNTCTHEETRRGGFIWEICDQCGMRWADDEGGRPEWVDPPEWGRAEDALDLTAPDADGSDGWRSMDWWEAQYQTWPEDVRKKISIYDLRRMSGWRPPGEDGACDD